LRRNCAKSAGIAFALGEDVWTEEQRLEFYCRLGLLAVAFLHWIIFALLIRSDVEAVSDQLPPVSSNLASVLLQFLHLS
jgi:hypothetical protein